MQGLKPNEQLLLTWLWFHKNNEGVCWPSINVLAKECGFSRDTVMRCLAKLESKGLIKKTKRQKEDDSANTSNLYDLLIYPHPSSNETPPSSRVRLPLVAGCDYPSSRVRLEPYKENHNHIEPKSKYHCDCVAEGVDKNKTEKVTQPEDWLTDKQEHIRIIALYAIRKGLRFESKEAGQSFIRRNVRYATLLKGYKPERLKEVMDWLEENEDFKWTLETVGKYIDENLAKLSKKEAPLIIEPLEVLSEETI